MAFAAFVLATLALHWGVPRRVGWQNGVLLLAGVVFYLSWAPTWLPMLAIGAVVDFWAARRMADASATSRTRRLALLVGLASNLGVLLWFKYAGFFVASAAAALDALGLGGSTTTLALVLPIGLSYYTLIRVGYLLDVRFGRVAPERSLLRFAVFVSFFPQMVAGPITRASTMLPQLATARRWQDVDVGAAAAALVLGWALKGYVADWIGPALVDPVFAAPDAASTLAHWAALAGYALQVFGDFAGYSLLAIGVAQLFGITLPVNFDRPFLSRSMPEFWRRWHISLNTWLFDYVFGPLTTGAGRLHGRVATNLILVFVLSGAWHGARATFLVWGLLHGIALAAHEAWDRWYRARCRVDRRFVRARTSLPYAFVAWALTQSWFLGTLILFRSPDLASAADFAAGLFSASGAAMPPLDTVGLATLVGALALVGWHHVEATAPGARLRVRIDALPAPVLGIAVGVGICWLLVFAPLARTSVIYAQF